MSKVIYEMKPVEEKRKKLLMKKSVYDPMIDAFLESGDKLVEITVPDKKAGYVVIQLTKRIEKRKLEITASAAQNFVYLEVGKKETGKPKE